MDYFDILLARNLANKGDITTESLSVTENGTYTAPSGKAYTSVTVEVQPPENSYQLKSMTTPTSLATFNASEMPMPSLKASIKAQQDLHGYDKPWVGGAGKNKLENIATSQTINGVTFTVNDDGSVLVNGTATNVAYFDISTFSALSQSYIVNGCPVGGSYNTSYSIWAVSENPYNEAVDSGSGITINENFVRKIRIRIANGYTASNLLFKPMIRLASVTDATFAPYSNECPISGWDEAKVTRCGKNLCGELEINTFQENQPKGSTYDDIKVYRNTRFITKELIPISNGVTVNCDFLNYQICFCLFDELKRYLGKDEGFIDWTAQSRTIYGASYVAIALKRNDGNTITADDFTNCHLQVELGSTATTYEPYNGKTVTISLPQTVYGGELDVVNGILKITDGYIASYNGETLPSTWISSMDVYAEGTSPTTGAEVCYELANPIIINLTPSLIKSLNGQNNLSVDCGEIIEGEYFKALGGE